MTQASKAFIIGFGKRLFYLGGALLEKLTVRCGVDWLYTTRFQSKENKNQPWTWA